MSRLWIFTTPTGTGRLPLLNCPSRPQASAGWNRNPPLLTPIQCSFSQGCGSALWGGGRRVRGMSALGSFRGRQSSHQFGHLLDSRRFPQASAVLHILAFFPLCVFCVRGWLLAQTPPHEWPMWPRQRPRTWRAAGRAGGLLPEPSPRTPAGQLPWGPEMLRARPVCPHALPAASPTPRAVAFPGTGNPDRCHDESDNTS